VRPPPPRSAAWLLPAAPSGPRRRCPAATGAPRAGRPGRIGAGARPRVRSHCRFRIRGTDHVRKSVMKWMKSGAKRQCDRALAPPRRPLPASRCGARAARRWPRRSRRCRACFCALSVDSCRNRPVGSRSYQQMCRIYSICISSRGDWSIEALIYTLRHAFSIACSRWVLNADGWDIPVAVVLGAQLLQPDRAPLQRLGADVTVIPTPPCICCIDDCQ
jgi:hypothetical protein